MNRLSEHTNDKRSRRAVQALFLGFLILLGQTFVSGKTIEDPAWILKRDKDGVRVYFKESKDNPIKRFRAVTEVESDLSSVVALLKDVPQRTKWSDGVRAASFLKEGRYRWIMHLEIVFPWPFENRDMVLENSLSQDPHSKVVTIQMYSASGLLKKQDGLTRITKAEGQWVLTPLANGKIEVVYEFLADPAGSIPVWVVDMFAVDGPFKTLKNMKKALGDPNYTEVKLGYIQN